MAASASGESFTYGYVGNIPAAYHSSDLRNYFSQFIERGGFDCFHFRHRPEIRKPVDSDPSMSNETELHPQSQTTGTKTLCCVFRLKKQKLEELIRQYHRKHWLDRNGESIRPLCLIKRVRIMDEKDMGNQRYKTRREQKQIPQDREQFTRADLSKLIELHPPDIMPNGNVGTPTLVFLDLIKQCRLPPVIIKKLGLSFPKTRSKRKYGNVPFEYGGEVIQGDSTDTETHVISGSGHVLQAESATPAELLGNQEYNMEDRTKGKKEDQDSENEENEDSDPDNDDDTCEEWERHEATTDDPWDVERNKERLFEEDIELKWEKGGSGLVFYTDAQYWDEQEGDFDAKTADDWDVDMSAYYDAEGGDMDARDFLAMRKETRRRNGEEDISVVNNKIGKFERHTKGIGRTILERQGWTDGQGLGSTIRGMADALDNDGQHPKDKKGLGYHGEKLIRYGFKRPRAEKQVIISTIYDNPEDTDPAEPLLRRKNPHSLKYREPVNFTKACDKE
ncbi:G patch domain-containing protein 3 [Lingula anatina]|uniref:G patch domain-containing protein 3 n=1 Tax=Lingula anatina TaxID=7574 RepID=A0A1S3H2E2_LINAN|nr:G patch domain-containing protein 3 [Lingula anatina]|eukprot:XP_013379646.1 G patch domain-containing protein 3 [Lingula anatina]